MDDEGPQSDESYIQALASGEVTEDMVEAIIEAFAFDSSLEAIVDTTALPEDVVREVLSRPGVAKRAMTRKRRTLGVLYRGQVIDRLKRMVDDSRSDASILRAIPMLEDMLTPPRRKRVQVTGSVTETTLEEPTLEEMLTELETPA